MRPSPSFIGIFAIVSLLLVAAVESFVVVGPRTAVFGRSTSLLSRTSLLARPDASAAIEAAKEATKKYGPTSPEARVAWEFVEEMDSSDNSVASEPSLEKDFDVSGDVDKAREEYEEKYASLQALVAEYTPKFQEMKTLANDLKAIKLAVGESKPGEDSPEMREALENAKAVQEEFGAGSDEAKVAWAELEEVASSGLSNAMGPRLDEECLVDSAMEACEAIEELSRALEKTKEASDS